MVANMIKWRPWLPLQSKKFEVKIGVNSIKGMQLIDDDRDDEKKGVDFDGLSKLKVEIKWKGCKNNRFRPLKKKTDCSKEVCLSQNFAVEFDDEFNRVCELYGSKDEILGGFLPWEVVFLVFHSSKKRINKMVQLTAPTVLNLSEFVSMDNIREFDINIPLSILHSGLKCSPSLCISLSLKELRSTQELSVEVQRPMTMFAPLSPCFGVPPVMKKDETSSLKSSLRKVKSLTDFVSSRKLRKAYQGEGSSDSKFSTGSDNSGYNSPFDSTDSLDDTDEDELQESKEDADVQNFCNYGTLVHANLAGGALDLREDSKDNDLVYYSSRKPHVESSPSHDFSTSVSLKVQKQSPKFGLSWSKGKLSFKSRKVKGEPLLKKDYGEEGGDDIDFYRRQFSSDESSMQFEGSLECGSSFISEFGDDYFAVGSWEQKKILNRDASMKLQIQIFFASIDQRSERAAGESACTALVAIMADWFHSNQGGMPIKSEFDSLIREGSLQWRNLCENEEYREKFPDKHFDLETVIQAQIRPLSIVPEKSFIGFFHPEGLDEECFSFLHGAMSFENIWDEISRAASELDCNSEPLVYVVSWNDHFFILKVDWDAYYIIDTLGERLFEGCKQAYVLKFDRDTIIESIPCITPSKDEKTAEKGSQKAEPSLSMEQQETLIDEEVLGNEEENQEVVCRGKECCKEYIKSFLAAIPIREMQIDLKKGLLSSTPLHHRLQIEFNLTNKQQFFPIPAEYIDLELADEIPAMRVDIPTLTEADVLALTEADVQASTMEVDVPAITAVDLQASMEVDVPTPVMAASIDSPMVADVPASLMTVAVA